MKTMPYRIQPSAYTTRYPNVPAALQGLAADTPPGFRDEPAFYVKDYVLAGNGGSTDTVDIDRDADFVWRAISYTSSGSFSVQFTDSMGFSYSNARVASANYSSDPANPTAWEVEVQVPARGKIKVDILDTSGAANTIQLAFMGVHRFQQ